MRHQASTTQRGHSRSGWAVACALVVVLWASSTPATTFHSRESALQLAFPRADEITPLDLTLTTSEATQVTAQAGARLDSRLITVYAGRADGELLGWAFIDTHQVRSLPETVLLVVAPDGRVAATHLLAFHEPEEYQASPRWFEQFRDLQLAPDLALGKSVAGIAGSTLTARAVTASVRRMLAVWQVKLSGNAIPDDPS